MAIDSTQATPSGLDVWPPIVASGGGGGGDLQACHGRLTLTSGVPVTTSDVIGATSVYWTPYKGNTIGLYVGAAWVLRSFSEITLALGTLSAPFQGYDIFGYDSSGALALEMDEWSNSSVTVAAANPGVFTWTGNPLVNGDIVVLTASVQPGGFLGNNLYFVVGLSGNTFNLSASPGGTGLQATSAGTSVVAHSPNHRQTALALQNGVYVKGGDATRRYLGSFLSTSTTTTEDSGVGSPTGSPAVTTGKRFLWNCYNRVRRSWSVMYGQNSWAPGGLAWRPAANNQTIRFMAFFGLAEDETDAYLNIGCNFNASNNPRNGIGLDQCTSTPAFSIALPTLNSRYNASVAWRGVMGVGLHALYWMEYGCTGGTLNEWFGTDALTPSAQYGMLGSVFA